MRRTRLTWLLPVLGALIVVRWLFPPQADARLAVASAVVRMPTLAEPVQSPTAAAAAPATTTRRVDFADRPDLLDEPGNAFAIRRPNPPAPPPVFVQPVPDPASLPVVFAPPPPPPPPPPLQVIGTWDDGVAPGVFMAAPQGTLLARPGTVLLAEYRVTAITAEQVSLLHLASKREFNLAVPKAPLHP